MSQTNPDDRLQGVINLLKAKADAKHRAGMLRFGVDNRYALGVKIPEVPVDSCQCTDRT